ncbi:diacylglycerol/lipid kinase family protein [Geomonas sp.]|uniref:diacylglycerol/lipid kinase family protein n=1 Tax=Geomonas sp. TaxID=2651584 RepID=UPI002B495EB1|nr:diacylglycerol kinase family protein [Geomonas sp.]HJV34238.1 diacylglycerol kinase family protein [Geomonas sp.]
MPKPCFLIVNPTSGTYSQKKIDHIMAILAERGLPPLLMPTASAADPARFAARICQENEAPLILVAGGDGTLNGVLNGLAPGAATLGVIPLGTSNVLARELEIHSVEDAVKRVIRGECRPIPVGEMICGGESRRFLLMAGVGVDGAVVRGVRLPEKRLVGKAAYALSALRLLFAWDRTPLMVTADGSNLSCDSVIVCNAAKYGGNFVLSPGGGLFTPGFQVICISGGRLAYLKIFLRLLLGKISGSRSVTIFTASELKVEGGKAVQCDGDFFGCAPLTLKSIPDFVRVIV